MSSYFHNNPADSPSTGGAGFSFQGLQKQTPLHPITTPRRPFTHPFANATNSPLPTPFSQNTPPSRIPSPTTFNRHSPTRSYSHSFTSSYRPPHTPGSTNQTSSQAHFLSSHTSSYRNENFLTDTDCPPQGSQQQHDQSASHDKIARTLASPRAPGSPSRIPHRVRSTSPVGGSGPPLQATAPPSSSQNTSENASHPLGISYPSRAPPTSSQNSNQNASRPLGVSHASHPHRAQSTATLRLRGVAISEGQALGMTKKSQKKLEEFISVRSHMFDKFLRFY